MNPARAPRDSDATAIRRAALRTALQVAGVTAAIVVAMLGLAALFVIGQSTPRELLEPGRPGETKIYIDAQDVLLVLAALGVAGIAVVGLASWVISRRAVAPLGDALRMQRAFVADASHELRTPLTVLDTRLHLLRRRMEREEPALDTLTAVERDVRVMIDLVTDLLLVAEASAHGVAGTADLRPVVLAAARDLELLAAEHDVAVETEVPNEAQVALTEPSLRRALVVLIDNAVTHSPEGSTVRVSAVVEQGVATVRVADQGAGIVGVSPGRVFDRFTHGSETVGRRGFGIGLSLVRDLAVRSGGAVRVESTGPSGTVMRLELPLVR